MHVEVKMDLGLAATPEIVSPRRRRSGLLAAPVATNAETTYPAAVVLLGVFDSVVPLFSR